MLRESCVHLFDPPEFAPYRQVMWPIGQAHSIIFWVTALVTRYSPDLPLTSVSTVTQEQGPVCPAPDSIPELFPCCVALSKLPSFAVSWTPHL